VGVPVGGTAGQFLQKTTTGVDYATDWTTVNLSAYAVKANNLSDLPSAPDARTNLGLGTMATATASDYSTTVAANGLYYPLSGNPSGFLTASSLTGYATESFVTSQGYITSAALTPYITSATATASFYPLSGNPSGFLTSAPVTSVAGRTGAITLSNTDISGLGSLAVVNDAPSDGSQYARKNAAWNVVVPGDRYLSSSTTSNTVSNGNKTFTIGTGLAYTPTQNITISYDASNHMHGEVLTYNSGTGVLTVDVNYHTGSGTYASWVVNVGGVTPATSVAWGSITGTLSSQTDLQSALDLKLAATTAATTYYPLVGNPSSFLVAADITGKANLASPTFTGTVTIPAGASIDGYLTTAAGNAAYVAKNASISIPSGNNLIINDGGFLPDDVYLDNYGLTVRNGTTLANIAQFRSDVVLIPAVGITFNDATVQTSAGLSAATAAATYAPINAPTFTGVVTIPGGASITGYATTTDVGLKANIASPTFTGVVTTAASASGSAGFLIPHGSAPSSPVNGDIWTTTAGLFYRINGATVSPATLAGGTFTGKITTVASAAGTAGFRLPTGAAPTTPVSGDIWTTAAGLFANIGALATQQVALLGTTTNFTGTFTLSGATANLGNSTAASTTNVASGATLAATTKTVNIGTNGVATSITNINVGSTTSTTTITLNGTVNATGLSNSVKAWVNFNGTGTPAIRASYNVSSITDNGVGDYTLNFTTALADANYAASAFAGDAAFSVGVTLSSWGTYTQTTSAFRFKVYYSLNTTVDATNTHVTIIR
jgi:hypothetical protein